MLHLNEWNCVYHWLLGYKGALFNFTWQHISFGTSPLIKHICHLSDLHISQFHIVTAVQKNLNLILLHIARQKIYPHNLCLYGPPLKYNINCTTKTWKRILLYFAQFSNKWELVLFDHSIPNSLQKEKKQFIFYAKFSHHHLVLHVTSA